MNYIQECLDKTATSEMFEIYREPLEELAFARKCQAFGARISGMARENDQEALRHDLEKGLMEMLSSDDEARDATVAEIAHRVREGIVKRSEEGGGIKGIKTGFKQLDWLTGGLQPGTMSIIAARPSTGKSALGINIWVNIGLHQKIPAVFFSAEMTADQVMERVYADLTTISLTNISRATLSPADHAKLEEAESKVAEASLFIDDSSRDISRICAKARYYVKAKGAKVIFVDYLQYLEANGGRMTRYETVTLISSKLKALAKDLNVPVLVAAQVNRQSEEDKTRPRIHNLRESGSIEQDADLIMLLHEGEDAVNTDPEIDVIGYLDKQRQGQRGSVVFRLQRRYCRFREKGAEV
jgi:replicative DNA helicase